MSTNQTPKKWVKPPPITCLCKTCRKCKIRESTRRYRAEMKIRNSPWLSSLRAFVTGYMGYGAQPWVHIYLALRTKEPERFQQLYEYKPETVVRVW